MDSKSSAVRVPTLVGLSVEEAHDAALDAGLLAVEHDAPPARQELGDTTATATTGEGAVAGIAPVRRVYRQELPAGAAVATGTRVRIWARRPDDPGPDDDGGGGGGTDLSPTGPVPQSGSGTK